MDTIPQPTAWLTCGPDTYHNPEFLRLFKDAEQYRDMTHWHFEHPDAHRIVENWEEIAEWWVATGRLRAVTDPHDQELARCLELNLANPEFRVIWESQVIPVDPSSRKWYVNDIDDGVQLAIDMRVWRHPYRNGMMLTGFSSGTERRLARGNSST